MDSLPPDDKIRTFGPFKDREHRIMRDAWRDLEARAAHAEETTQTTIDDIDGGPGSGMLMAFFLVGLLSGISLGALLVLGLGLTLGWR